MSSDSIKCWQRPWTTEEIIKNAPKWSLAGDAGLLRHLEAFSENLLSKADETNNNLNRLLSGLDNASISLEEVKNDFRALRNTQFIESRVYEDDETVPEETEASDEKVKRQTKEEKLNDIKEAILGGISIVEKYFDKVEVPGSDSEDETDFTSFVLKPKDPYVDRPLPFLIGTDEWYKKWHVGLLDSSSESEDEKQSEKFSDTDSDSELSYDANKVNEVSRPVANSTFNESIKPPLDLLGDSDTETTDNSTANRNFANELATKLGRYVDEPEVNRKPINANVNVKEYGNLFSDEPPPIDNNNEKGLFSDSEGLFDGLDNNVDLWKDQKQKKTEKSSFPNLFDDDDDLFNNTVAYGTENTSNAKNAGSTEVSSGGLFDDEDDDLFNENLSKTTSTRPSLYLPPAKTTSIPYFVDEPPELESTAPPEVKKPFGGVKLIEQSDLDRLVKQRQNLSQSSDDIKSSPLSVSSDLKKDESTSTSITKTEVTKKPKQLSLFDDDEDDERDLFEKDLFSNISFDSSLARVGAKEAPLFDNYGENDELFAESIKPEVSPENDSANNIPPLPNALDSNTSELDDYWDSQSENPFDDGGLFDNVQEINSQRSSLFDNEPPSLFFESSGIVKDISTRVGNDESFSPHATSSRRFSSDIYNEQQSNDSFFVTKNKSQFEHPHAQSNLDIIPENSDTRTNDISESNLEITPSGDIDDLYSEVTASNFDITQSAADDSIQTVNESVSSPKFDSPSKLKLNLNINVSALMPGASPPKRKQSVETETMPTKPSELEDEFNASMRVESEVLPSITKDRVRIPVKRRPSTRKARQESLRNSVPDFSILSNVNDEVKVEDAAPKTEFVDIFEDDLFAAVEPRADLFDTGSPPLFNSIAEKTDSKLSIVNQVTSIIESQPKEPVDKPKQSLINSISFESEEYKQLSMFDDADEFDDMFSSNKLPPKSKMLRESLFGDDDLDDDDIFGSSSASKQDSKLKANTSSEKKTTKTVQVKRLENSEVLDDPLSSFLND